jgi:hypothetical protein
MIEKIIIILVISFLIFLFYDVINWGTVQFIITFLLFLLYSYRYYTTSKMIYFILIIVLYCISLYLLYSNNFINVYSSVNPFYIIGLIGSVFLLIAGLMFKQYTYIMITAFSLILFVLFMNYVLTHITDFFIYLSNPELSYKKFYISLIIIAILIFIYLCYKTKKTGQSNIVFNFVLSYWDKIYYTIRNTYIDYLVEYNMSEDYDIIITVFSIILLILILFYKQLYHYFIHLNKGVYLIHNPITLSEETQLNYKPEFKYKYGLSVWIWFNSVNSTNNTVRLLNYGNCPLIEYNSQKNEMNIIFLNENKLETKIVSTKVDMQKWINIVINSVGGTIDVFINGKLIKTMNNIIPVKSISNITVGSNEGMSGGLSNLMYFKEPLTLYQINEIYAYTPKY